MRDFENALWGLAWRFILKPILFVGSVGSIFTGIRGISEARLYQHPVVLSCAQFMRHPPRAGWFKITDCIVDLSYTGYETRKDSSVTKVYARVYPPEQEGRSPYELIVRTENSQDLEWIENKLAAREKYGNGHEMQWLLEHWEHLHPRRTLEGMLRTRGVSAELREVGMSPGAVLLEENERPSYSNAVITALLGLVVSTWIGLGWWNAIRPHPERWLRRRRLATAKPLETTGAPGTLIRAAIEAGGILIPGRTVEVPEGNLGVVVREGSFYDRLEPGVHEVCAGTLPILASHLPLEVWEERALEATLVLVRGGTILWCWTSEATRSSLWAEETGTVRGEAALEIHDPLKLLAGVMNLLHREHYDVKTLKSPGLVFWRLTDKRRAGGALPTCGDGILSRYVARFVYAAVGNEWAMARADTASLERLQRRGCQAISDAFQYMGARCVSLTLEPITDWRPVSCQHCGAAGAGVRDAHFSATAGALFWGWDATKQGYFCRACGTRLGCSAILWTCAAGWLNPLTLIMGLISILANLVTVIRLWAARDPNRS